MQDLIAGQIDMMVDNPANALPQVRAGAIKVYAVTAMSRMPTRSIGPLGRSLTEAMVRSPFPGPFAPLGR